MPTKIAHWRHLVEIVALIGAAIWAFYVFIYQEKIKPAGEPPRLQTGTEVTHHPLRGGKELITLTVELKNTGSNDIAMGALLVNAYGLRYRPGSVEWEETLPANSVTTFTHGLKSEKRVLLFSQLQQWKPTGGARRPLPIPVGEENPLVKNFVIEQGAFDSIATTYAFCYQRLDDPRVTSYTPQRAADGAFDPASLVLLKRTDDVLCGGSMRSNSEYPL